MKILGFIILLKCSLENLGIIWSKYYLENLGIILLKYSLENLGIISWDYPLRIWHGSFTLMDMESLNDSVSCLNSILAAYAKSCLQVQALGSCDLELFTQVIYLLNKSHIFLHDSNIICLVVLGVLVQLLRQWIDRLLQMFTLTTILFLDILVNIDSFRLKLEDIEMNKVSRVY